MPLPTTNYDRWDGLAPTGSVTDFPIVIDLSRATAAWWAAVDTSDGRRGRAALGDGTEAAVDWIDFDSVNETGIAVVKWSGTRAAPDTPIVHLYPPNTSNSVVLRSDPMGGQNAYPASMDAYWPLTLDFTDRSGNNNDGTAAGGITAGGAPGKLGSATAFDGIDDWVDMVYNPNIIGSVGITVLAWANTNISNWRNMVGDTSSPSKTRIGMRSGDRWWGRLNGTFVNGNPPVALNVWTHAAAKGGSAGQSLWLNGAMEASIPTALNSYTQSNFNIGRDEVSRFWDGELQHIRVFSTALPDAWIAYDYTQTNDQAAFWGVPTNVAAGSSRRKAMVIT